MITTRLRAPGAVNNMTPHSLNKRENQFSVMSTASRELLFETVHVEKLYRGQTLLKEGQICRNIYFIESGQLRTFYNKNGKEININFWFENNFATNLKSLMTEAPSDFYITANEPTTVWKFNKDQLLYLYSQSCEIESFGRKVMEQLLIKQVEHSNLFKIYTPAERYHYVEKYYPELLQRVSLSQLSSYLGISRETISRIRKRTFPFFDF